MPRSSELDAEQDQLILGHALRSLRKRAGMTQEQVAERLGVDPTFIGRLERGQRGAHWRTIRRILAAVDASVSDFANEIDAAERPRRRS
jgi:XRE family transcriptional regulator, regulator of sulfur utilization